ncbi:MAG: DUF3991 and TOPRIM domain-containing protein [Victivallales bacterium]|nr:DUF3991 and TOPRIM domain-containing protein [Victivallales bacterium]
MDIKKHNLAQFAQDFYGFTEKKNSTAKNPCLTNGGDTIVIKRQQDGNYTFWSPTSKHKGSVIDLIMWQENVGMTQACKIAGEKISGFSQDGKVQTPKHLEPVPEFDQSKVEQLIPVKAHKYLEGRGIDNLDHGRFKGTVFTDKHHNAVFPHTNAAGKIIGYAMKNTEFNGFSPGGSKSVWKSNQFRNDNQLVVTESAVDALSYAKMLDKHDQKQFFNTRFISTEGAFSPEVRELIAAEIASMPETAKVIAAFDNDDQGWKYAAELKEICANSGRNCRTDIPKVKGYDWNKVLVRSLELLRNATGEAAAEKKQEAGQEQEQAEAATCQM